MLSLYFCRAVRVDCPASLYKEKTDYKRQIREDAEMKD